MRERRRVMIAGTGEKCYLKNLNAKNIDLRRKTVNLKKDLFIS